MYLLIVILPLFSCGNAAPTTGVKKIVLVDDDLNIGIVDDENVENIQKQRPIDGDFDLSGVGEDSNKKDEIIFLDVDSEGGSTGVGDEEHDTDGMEDEKNSLDFVVGDSSFSTSRASQEGEEKDQENTANEEFSKERSDGMESNEDKIKTVQPISHAIFDELCKQYISPSGNVNYTKFKNDESRLNVYLDLLRNNPPAETWSKKAQLAYWINAYNAFTIKLILKNFPVKKITDLDGGKPWDKKWIKIGKENYSLNNIEHDIMRPKFNEPRIHFAVNCAAVSCPPINNKAWTDENIEIELERVSKAFINNPKLNQISKSSVKLSKIFEWYKSDFGDLIEFINEYSQTKISKGSNLNYLEYNWSLNGS